MSDVYVRELSFSDLSTINKWRNCKDNIDFLGSNFRYVDVEVDNRWFESYQNNRSNNVRLSICCKSTDKVIGLVYLLNIDWVNRSTEFAIWLGDEISRGKGIGKYVATLALEHAFLDLNLHKVYLTVLVKNKAAIKLYKSLGFKEEGVLVDAIYKNGNYESMISMAILNKRN
ncbi:GNAT family N-acetyltransferase [Vibrio kanaloae]|uniref:GNAT family N-acetyltransferase n=1 Tax=Vibrio kanaloae TaxID=170673 RepID=UPI0035A68DFA